VIASGGARKAEDFYQAVVSGASAVAAASVFHYGILTIDEVKEYLMTKNIECRRAILC